jgi:hypothetical protein
VCFLFCILCGVSLGGFVGFFVGCFINGRVVAWSENYEARCVAHQADGIHQGLKQVGGGFLHVQASDAERCGHKLRLLNRTLASA